MASIKLSAAFEKNHAALAARLMGLRSSLYLSQPVLLLDESEEIEPEQLIAASGVAADGDESRNGGAKSRLKRGAKDALHILKVARGSVPGIAEGGKGARSGTYNITYHEGNTADSLAAILACVAGAGAPIAADPESLSVLALSERLADSEIPVLIGGPTGTGKEVLSRFIHNHSNRAGRPFVAVNCAAIPEAMLEAMLFGHRKGAFTGATDSAEGFFRAADGGTLLLDEIAEMPLALQAKLLRALQEGEVTPVGSARPIKVDVRIIACANRELPEEVAAGRFREDLYYRLNVFPISLRPLCERPGDIAPLAFAMMLRHAPAFNQAVPWIAPQALEMLEAHNWPGNVRELENVVRRALVMAAGRAEIGPHHIIFDSAVRPVSANAHIEQHHPAPQMPPAQQGSGAAAPRKLSKIVQLSEARAIMDTLQACGGKRIEAAKRLGISERTLRYRLAAFREAGIAMAGAGS